MVTFDYHGKQLPLVPHKTKPGKLAAYAQTRRGFPPVAVFETDAPVVSAPKPVVFTPAAVPALRTGTQSPAAPASKPVTPAKKED